MARRVIAFSVATILAIGFAQAGALDKRAAGSIEAGDAYLAEGKIDQAIENYAYASKGEHDKAAADYEAAIKVYSTWIDRQSKGRGPSVNESESYEYSRRAEAYDKLGRKAEAIADYRSALALWPAGSEAQAALRRLGAGP